MDVNVTRAEFGRKRDPGDRHRGIQEVVRLLGERPAFASFASISRYGGHLRLDLVREQISTHPLAPQHPDEPLQSYPAPEHPSEAVSSQSSGPTTDLSPKIAA